ncbi:hypothetical protein FOZ63_001057 [Perkinsus olseni]|uniref:Uncharacterized protein n=1 Tax=Perkinsus olseni TaxID=32597 RepID=A0A7J6T625_PEROL|nr:hypothetical protein FOZ62_011947 [Perkinsus olseni]KAF4749912.1 hypothetical protein FOZ63_001057 [Perkinsus olseni]
MLGLIVSSLARAVAAPSTEDVISQTVVEIWRDITAATPEHKRPVYYNLIVSRLFGLLRADDDGNRQPKLNIQGRRGLFLVIAHFTRALVESVTSRPVEEATRPSLLDLHVTRIFQLLKENCAAASNSTLCNYGNGTSNDHCSEKRALSGRTSVELELSISAAVEHLAAGHAPSPPSLSFLANTCLSVINGMHSLKGAKLEMGRPLAFAATVCLGHLAKWGKLTARTKASSFPSSVNLNIVTTREVLDSLDRTNLALYELTRSNPRLRQAIAFARQAWTLAAAVDHQGAAAMHQQRFTESPRRSKSYEMGEVEELTVRLELGRYPHHVKSPAQVLKKRQRAGPAEVFGVVASASYHFEKRPADDNAGEEVLIIDGSTHNSEDSEDRVEHGVPENEPDGRGLHSSELSWELGEGDEPIRGQPSGHSARSMEEQLESLCSHRSAYPPTTGTTKARDSVPTINLNENLQPPTMLCLDEISLSLSNRPFSLSEGLTSTRGCRVELEQIPMAASELVYSSAPLVTCDAASERPVASELVHSTSSGESARPREPEDVSGRWERERLMAEKGYTETKMSSRLWMTSESSSAGVSSDEVLRLVRRRSADFLSERQGFVDEESTIALRLLDHGHYTKSFDVVFRHGDEQTLTNVLDRFRQSAERRALWSLLEPGHRRYLAHLLNQIVDDRARSGLAVHAIDWLEQLPEAQE